MSSTSKSYSTVNATFYCLSFHSTLQTHEETFSCSLFSFFKAIAGLFSLTVNVQAWAEPSETLWACSFLQNKSTFGNKREKKDDFLVTNSFKGQTQLHNQTPPDSAPPTSLHERVTRSQQRFYHIFALFVCNVISSKVPLSVKSCISLVYMHFCSVCSHVLYKVPAQMCTRHKSRREKKSDSLGMSRFAPDLSAACQEICPCELKS